MKTTSFNYDEKLTAGDLANNAETIRNVRLWDPDVLQRTYEKLQEIRSYYQFNDVDVDRYMIDGRPTQVELSARDLNPGGLPSQSWVNQPPAVHPRLRRRALARQRRHRRTASPTSSSRTCRPPGHRPRSPSPASTTARTPAATPS